jgi:hypothetical protein
MNLALETTRDERVARRLEVAEEAPIVQEVMNAHPEWTDFQRLIWWKYDMRKLMRVQGARRQRHARDDDGGEGSAEGGSAEIPEAKRPRITPQAEAREERAERRAFLRQQQEQTRAREVKPAEEVEEERSEHDSDIVSMPPGGASERESDGSMEQYP